MTPPVPPPNLPPPPPPPPHKPYWSVTYHTPDVFGMHLGVDFRGGAPERPRSSTEVRANWRRGQEIGYYTWHPPDEKLEAVRRLVLASNFEDHAHSGPVQPDTPMTGLGYNPHGDPYEFRSFVTVPPEAVQKAMAAIEDLAAEALDHPFIAITAQGRWLQPRVATGRSLDFEVTFGARGKEPPGLRNPLSVQGSDWAHLHLRIRRDVPDEELDWQKDVKMTELFGADITTSEGRRGGPDILRLDPGSSITLRGHKRMHLSPGRYRGEVVYAAGRREWNETERWVVPGRLTIDLGTIEVTNAP